MWASESEFADTFEGCLRRRGKALGQQGKGTVVLREYQPGYGRVDMVMVVYDFHRLSQRRRRSGNCSDWRRLNIRSAYVMSYLTRTRWVSLKRLGGMMNMGLTRTRRVVSDLESRGLVETRPDLVKAHAKRINLVIDHIETFELKLENWQRALEQAGRHLWFASRSYVVMPRPSDRIARRLAENCIEWNVGAILLHAYDNWEVLCRCRDMTVPTSHIGWLLNESIVSEETYA